MNPYYAKKALFLFLVGTTLLAGVMAGPGPTAKTQADAKAEIAVSGDSRGRLIGTVSADQGRTGLPGESVSVSGDSWTRTAVTGENGLFIVDMPLGVRGPISVKARGVETVVDASNIPLRLTLRPVSGSRSLEGEWQILTDPPADWRSASGWRQIPVPSNWEMKGFKAESGTAVMRKTFDLPEAWNGRLIKLRADGIYSRCEAWLNGVRVGGHDGGATPIEFDLTDAARPGRENTIEIYIQARSTAAEIDRMSIYAYFEIAGIWRPIEVFSVAPAHVARTSWSVNYDGPPGAAILDASAVVANARKSALDKAVLKAALLDPDGRTLAAKTETVSAGPWEEKTIPLRFKVAKPQPWNAERPRVYTLRLELDGETIETPVGFRQMKVQGQRFTINGKGAKLFGVCLHSADPLNGRAVSAALVKQDLELIKGANLNAVRTSHYPPHPALPGLADRIGLYVEDEGPACWSRTDDLRDAPLYMGIYSAFVERDRNHPSVVYWSICNESEYTRVMKMTQQFIKTVDPTRPSAGSFIKESDPTDFMVEHHPANLGSYVRSRAGLAKPMFLDESQGVFHGWGELAVSVEVDPGMRDYWITGIKDNIRACHETANQVGTMIWAWVDDAFLIPGKGIGVWRRDMPPIRYTESIYAGPGHGYVGDCAWGVVDGWRRPRPEWELLRKVYAPAEIANVPLPSGPVRVPVFNQNVFENLDIYECRWTLGKASGTVRGRVAPRASGTIVLPAVAGPDDVLYLDFYDGPRLVDGVRLAFKPRPAEPWSMGEAARLEEEKRLYLSGIKAIALKGDGCELDYDRTSGGLMWGLAADTQVLLGGPKLHYVTGAEPGTEGPSGWTFKDESHGPGRIQWNGSFGDAWTGGYEIRMDKDGDAEFSYAFTYKGPDLWVRELGLEFDLPISFDRLEWDRKSEFSVYSDSHIGRPQGVALAHSAAGHAVPPGDRPYGLDDHPWGSNDFRSAKRGIYWASLSGPGGSIKVVSDGTQTIRCAVGVREVSLRVLDYYGGSGKDKEWSVVAYHYGAGRLIKTGETVKGTARMRLKN